MVAVRLSAEEYSTGKTADAVFPVPSEAALPLTRGIGEIAFANFSSPKTADAVFPVPSEAALPLTRGIGEIAFANFSSPKLLMQSQQYFG